MKYPDLKGKQIVISDSVKVFPEYFTRGKPYTVVSGSGHDPEVIFNDDGDSCPVNAARGVLCGHLDVVDGWIVVEDAPKQSKPKIPAYAVVNAAGVQYLTEDRDLAREVKFCIGGKKAGAVIYKLKIDKEIR